MKKVVNVRINSVRQYVTILNGLFNLTSREIDVLAKFIEKYLILKDTGISVFSLDVKKQVASELGIDDFNRLNVYIKKLKDKRALIPTKDGYKIRPILLLEDQMNSVEFRWQEIS